MKSVLPVPPVQSVIQSLVPSKTRQILDTVAKRFVWGKRQGKGWKPLHRLVELQFILLIKVKNTRPREKPCKLDTFKLGIKNPCHNKRSSEVSSKRSPKSHRGRDLLQMQKKSNDQLSRHNPHFTGLFHHCSFSSTLSDSRMVEWRGGVGKLGKRKMCSAPLKQTMGAASPDCSRLWLKSESDKHRHHLSSVGLSRSRCRCASWHFFTVPLQVRYVVEQ